MKKSFKIFIAVISVMLLFSSIFMVVSLADSTEEATLVTEAEGSDPVTTHGSLSSIMYSVLRMKPTVKTTYTVTLNKDATLERYNFRSNSNASVVLNLNGHTLTDGSETTSANVFEIRKSNGENGESNISSLTVIGSDSQGNRGKLVVKSSVYLVFNHSVGSLKLSFKDLDVDFTHKDSASIATGIIYIYTGSLGLDNVHVTYRGVADGSTNPNKIMGFIRDPRATGTYNYIKNCSFTDLSSNVKTAVIAQVKQNATLENCSATTDYGVIQFDTETAAKAITFNGCSLSLSEALSTANYSAVKLINSSVNIGNGILGAGSGGIQILTNENGINTNKITTSPEMSSLVGSITVASGFRTVKTSPTTFEFLGADAEVTTLEMSSLFSSGMVIQRNKDINVWGFVNTDGLTVKVTLDGVTKEAEVKDGRFDVTFPPISAKRGIELNVKIPNAVNSIVDVTYSDIDVGDIFVMSGQSNLDYSTKQMEDIEEYLANADNYKNIRFFDNPSKWEINENTQGYGKWYDATRENLESIGTPAIGYVMATRLAAEYGNVTIAIVDCTYAGTMIQSWIDEATYGEMITDSNSSYYSYAILQAFQSYYAANGKMPEQKSDLESYFTNATAYASLTDDEFKKPYRVVTAICYNSLVAPLKGMAVRGVVWYQGEGNVIGDRYIPYYEALTESYRKTFSDDTLPFYVIQLAPYVNGNYNSSVSNTKAAQFKMVEADGYSYLISANLEGATASVQDLTSGKNSSDSLIHPARKSPIGHRLADAVLKYSYGEYENKTVTAPKPIRVELSGSSVIVTFDAPLSLFYGAEVQGFELSDGTGFVKATGVISDNTVILSAEGISTPTAVRYAYGFMTFELSDGTLIKVMQCSSAPGTSGTMTVVDENGIEHTFTAEEGGIVRGFIEGNLTNESGHPTPTFSLEVGYGTDSEN